MAARLLCAKSSVKLRHLREHRLEPTEVERIYEAQSYIDNALDMVIDDTPGQTLLSIRGSVRREAARHALSLVVVDYMQLMTLGYRSESRFVEVSAISRGLKDLARTIHCPVLACSQVNRECEGQWGDGKPHLHHLRESGSIEQDADIVMLLSWPKAEPGEEHYVIVAVEKNRHGPLGEVQIIWTPAYTRFSDK